MSTRGIIFDFRRFSTHDGNGIRTVVFLKGCPLKCGWCQNPEGISLNRSLIYFNSKCINCKICTKICSNESIVSKGDNIEIIRKKCTQEENDKLIYNCPTTALVMDSNEYDIDEVIKIVLKDKYFFKYEGGITLSGGEPFFQREFTLKILKRLKDIQINTAVESSLFVKSSYLEETLPYIDTLFADFKIYDTKEHKKHTGVENKLITSNLELILRSEHKDKIIVRTPLIPNITATRDNIHNISKFISDIYPNVKYEILNYNPLAKSKYDLIDELEYCFDNNPSMYSNEEMEMFYQIAYSAGIKNLIIQ